MTIKQIKKILLIAAGIYWAFALMVFLIAGKQFRETKVEGDSYSPGFSVGEIVDGTEITQQITIPADRFETVKVYVSTFARENTGALHMNVLGENGDILASSTVDIAGVQDGAYITFELDNPIEGKSGERATLKFTSEGCKAGNAVTFFAGNSIDTVRVSIEKEIAEEDLFRINGTAGTGMLCMKNGGVNFLRFYIFYWPVMAAIFAIAAIYVILSFKKMKQGKGNYFSGIITLGTKYKFLIKQLVNRDFKVKYKRSVLGIAWSFLNPLLMMLVQYLIFSTIFKSSVENFPVYLLSGTVFFNFFSEAVSIGMTSITVNASLIKKVYAPKYIYPISKVASSMVNFGLSFIPLLIVMIITGTRFTPALLLLIYDIFCLLLFTTGMTLILSTALVFFQDIQFLWGIISMIWMYATPIFYPDTIIPAQFMPIYRLNPLYQYLTFARTCITQGVSPHPLSYLWCFLPAAIVLVLGILIFKKQQDKFVLYL